MGVKLGVRNSTIVPGTAYEVPTRDDCRREGTTRWHRKD